MTPIATPYTNANLNAAVTILNEGGTGAVLLSGAFRRILIAADGAPVWVKLSKGNVVAATAGTNGEILIPRGTSQVINMAEAFTNLSIINGGANCGVSATPLG
jgi:hypothetical protein